MVLRTMNDMNSKNFTVFFAVTLALHLFLSYIIKYYIMGTRSSAG